MNLVYQMRVFGVPVSAFFTCVSSFAFARLTNVKCQPATWAEQLEHTIQKIPLTEIPIARIWYRIFTPWYLHQINDSTLWFRRVSKRLQWATNPHLIDRDLSLIKKCILRVIGLHVVEFPLQTHQSGTQRMLVFKNSAQYQYVHHHH